MKSLCRIFLLSVFSASFLLPACNSVPAQDVAAAARANRANHAASATAKPDGAWYSPTRVTLLSQDHGDAGTLTFEIADSRDLKITMDTSEKGKRQVGEIMVIQSGQRQWMLVKNLPLEKGYEIDALDVPVLSLKLVLELLRAAAPSGPSQIKEKTDFDISEEHRSIEISTPSANGGLQAPWTLHATIEPVSTEQSSFSLAATHGETMRLSGTWEKSAKPPAFPDNTPLDGWQVLGIGPIKTSNGNETILDYGAQPARQHPKTLGELRRIAAT